MINNVEQVTTVYYTKNLSAVIINGDTTKEYPVNYPVIEAWRNQGNTVAPYQPSIDELKISLKNELKELRKNYQYNPVEYNGYTIPNTEKAKSSLVAKYAMLLQAPANSTKNFLTVDGQLIQLTLSQLEDVTTTIEAQETGYYVKAATVKNQIDAKTDVTELENFDIQAAWDAA
jgi:hypothetical protein